jgi:hypothetical protein
LIERPDAHDKSRAQYIAGLESRHVSWQENLRHKQSDPEVGHTNYQTQIHYAINIVHDSTIAVPASLSHTGADETLAKDDADSSSSNRATTLDFIISPDNATEASAIDAGRQRGNMVVEAFDKAFKSEK